MLCSSTTVIARSLHRKMCSFQTFPTEGFPSYPIEISPCLPMFPRPTAPGVCECQSGTSFRSCRAPSRPNRCLRWILPYFHWIGTKSRFPGCQNIDTFVSLVYLIAYSLSRCVQRSYIHTTFSYYHVCVPYRAWRDDWHNYSKSLWALTIFLVLYSVQIIQYTQVYTKPTETTTYTAQGFNRTWR